MVKNAVSEDPGSGPSNGGSQAPITHPGGPLLTSTGSRHAWIDFIIQIHTHKISLRKVNFILLDNLDFALKHKALKILIVYRKEFSASKRENKLSQIRD